MRGFGLQLDIASGRVRNWYSGEDGGANPPGIECVAPGPPPPIPRRATPRPYPA